MILPPQRPLTFRLLPFLVALLCLQAGLGGCAGLVPAAPYTPTPSLPPGTATPTIAWFPATNTPTVYAAPSPQPTLEPLPGVEDLIFSDDFSDPDLWNTASSGDASVQVENNRLTLALSSGVQSVLSLRSEPVLVDFYAGVTASTALCQGNDQYGILFRAAPGGSFYRFSLACNGTIRFERVRGGAADLLQNWVPSGDAPPGAPAQVRIGVWVAGTEIRLLLNDHLQFSLRDPVLRAGTIGFFAAASGETPVLVSFSDLEAYSVVYIPPTPTPIPSRTPTP